MDIWVAVSPQVDQLTEVMPNFWRAVYVLILINPCQWYGDYSLPLLVLQLAAGATISNLVGPAVSGDAASTVNAATGRNIRY